MAEWTVTRAEEWAERWAEHLPDEEREALADFLDALGADQEATNAELIRIRGGYRTVVRNMYRRLHRREPPF